MKRISIDPITRLEGHGKIDIFLNDEGDVVVNWEGCLECGSCLICCDDRALAWHYPRGESGVQYRMS